MSGLRSKRKGAAGERELARFITDAGFPANRGRQNKGGPESPDVACHSLPWHIESKRAERLNLYAALAQATSEAPAGALPVVAHRRNGQEWVAILRLADLLELARALQPETSTPTTED